MRSLLFFLDIAALVVIVTSRKFHSGSGERPRHPHGRPDYGPGSLLSYIGHLNGGNNQSPPTDGPYGPPNMPPMGPSFLNTFVRPHLLPPDVPPPPRRPRDHDDVHIELVNRHQTGKQGGWIAGRTAHSGLSLEQKKKMTGVILEAPAAYLSDPHVPPPTAETRLILPDSFDARVAWPNCRSITEIRDQGQCGCCWAHAGASVISDRICIASANASRYFQASVQDNLVCSGGINNLCHGAYSRTAYIKYVERGLVSGGGYQSNSGCMPYTSYPVSVAAVTNSTTCPNTCTNTATQKSYNADKEYGANWYAMGNQYATTSGGAAGTVTNETVIKQIQFELMRHGPITVQTTVYEDFYNYAGGVYQYVTGASLGGHAMKLIGWGTDNGADYWLLANSWGTNWGIGGFAKWLRGVNHLSIEDYLVTALPRKPQTDLVIPPCGNTTESRAFCQGKWRYAIAPESVCSSQFCCCPGTCGPKAHAPFIAKCQAGKYMDPTPSVYSDNCAPPNTIPACSGVTAPAVTKLATTNAPSNIVAVSTPVPIRPQGYDRCDALFCDPKSRPTGKYYVSPCSRNYCSCEDGVPNWVGCPIGQVFDKNTSNCQPRNSSSCPVKAALNVSSDAPWPPVPANVSSLCNRENCAGRGNTSTWYALDICSPYWCYCWNTKNMQAVQLCQTGFYFDFRSETAACVNRGLIPWC